MNDLVRRLRSPAMCLYEWDADDGDIFREAADRITELEAKNAALQAHIDALMFEFCPDEMTQGQIAEYEKHQRPAGQREGIDQGLRPGAAESRRLQQRVSRRTTRTDF